MRGGVLHIFCLLVSLYLLSCSKFEYSEEVQSDETLVSVNVGGKGYRVMAERQVNSLHYLWQSDSVEQALRVGDYYAVAFLADEQTYQLSGLTEFVQDFSASMQDVYASLPELDLNDTLVDCNPYSPFIRHADGPLMCASQRFSARDSLMTVTFEPVSLTQFLKFRFSLHVDQDVEISSVNAILSGVAGRVKLMTGQVRNDIENPTYKVHLNTQMVSYGALMNYEASANILGLFPSVSEIYQVGPGILHLQVDAFVDDDGVLKEKVFYAGINLKALIEDAELMSEAEDQSGYRLNKAEAQIEIPVILEVKRDRVISGTGDGFSQWFINDGEINVEV